MQIEDAQADMRHAYVGGATGITTSGTGLAGRRVVAHFW